MFGSELCLVMAQINLYCHCNGCGFKKFAAIDENKINDLLKKCLI